MEMAVGVDAGTVVDVRAVAVDEGLAVDDDAALDAGVALGDDRGFGVAVAVDDALDRGDAVGDALGLAVGLAVGLGDAVALRTAVALGEGAGDVDVRNIDAPSGDGETDGKGDADGAGDSDGAGEADGDGTAVRNTGSVGREPAGRSVLSVAPCVLCRASVCASDGRTDTRRTRRAASTSACSSLDRSIVMQRPCSQNSSVGPFSERCAATGAGSADRLITSATVTASRSAAKPIIPRPATDVIALIIEPPFTARMSNQRESIPITCQLRRKLCMW